MSNLCADFFHARNQLLTTEKDCFIERTSLKPCSCHSSCTRSHNTWFGIYFTFELRYWSAELRLSYVVKGEKDAYDFIKCALS